MAIIADSITSDQAGVALAAARMRAAAIGVAANVALLDAGAHLKAFIRMDGAVLGAIDVAARKARTAALFAVGSADVWAYCRPGAAAPNLEASNGGLMPFPGGLPIIVDGLLIGAVGVSGGTPAEDLDIALAAVGAVAGGSPAANLEQDKEASA